MKATNGGSGHPADTAFFHGRSDGSNSKQPKAWEELRSNRWTRLRAASQQPNTCLLQIRCHRVQWVVAMSSSPTSPPSILPFTGVPRSLLVLRGERKMCPFLSLYPYKAGMQKEEGNTDASLQSCFCPFAHQP